MILNLFVIFSIVMLWCYYRSAYSKEGCINAIFAAMWVLFSIEFYTTTDYTVYYEYFDRPGEHAIWEPLYRLLLQLFQPFGFIVFNSAVSAFNIFTLCFMFKLMAPKRFIWVAILIFILATENMMAFMCLKRQFPAICISLWTLYFIGWSKSRLRWVWAVVTFLCAVNIHTSAYVTLSYFLLPLVRFRIGKVLAGVVAVLFLAGLSFSLSEYGELMQQAMALVQGGDDDDSRWGVYINDQVDETYDSYLKSVLASAFTIFYMAMIVVYNRRVTERQYWILLMNLISPVLGNVLLGDFYRLLYYYTILMPVSVAILLDYMWDDRRTFARTAVFWLFLGSSLAMPLKWYLYAMTGAKVTYMTIRFKHFQTIFDDEPDKTVYRFEGFRQIE